MRCKTENLIISIRERLESINDFFAEIDPVLIGLIIVSIPLLTAAILGLVHWLILLV